MSAALRDFLAARLPLPGLAAWSARLADRTVTHECFVSWLTPAQIEQILARLALASEGLQHQHIHPIRSCWVFEPVRLYLAARPDGACLALFMENRPDLPRAATENLLDAFTALPAG